MSVRIQCTASTDYKYVYNLHRSGLSIVAFDKEGDGILTFSVFPQQVDDETLHHFHWKWT
jgi:hypothetical protein